MQLRFVLDVGCPELLLVFRTGSVCDSLDGSRHCSQIHLRQRRLIGIDGNGHRTFPLSLEQCQRCRPRTSTEASGLDRRPGLVC
jgi:hypothetical protein